MKGPSLYFCSILVFQRQCSQGVRKIKKKPQKKLIWVEFLIWGVCEGDTILILEHAEEKKLIWGYASTKSLRTPDLNKSDKKCKANIDIKLENFVRLLRCGQQRKCSFPKN
jgi:hypothetical protein